MSSFLIVESRVGRAEHIVSTYTQREARFHMGLQLFTQGEVYSILKLDLDKIMFFRDGDAGGETEFSLSYSFIQICKYANNMTLKRSKIQLWS